MKTLVAGISILVGVSALSESGFAQRYRDYDDPPPRYREDRAYRGGYGRCLSSDGINARLRSEGYRNLALRDQGRGVLVMSTYFRGRPYLIFVNSCTGAVIDTRSQ